MSRHALVARHWPLAALHRLAPFERRTPGPDAGRERLRTDGRPEADRDDDHLRDVPDGAGCTEIWEHLSERTTADGDD